MAGTCATLLKLGHAPVSPFGECRTRHLCTRRSAPINEPKAKEGRDRGGEGQGAGNRAERARPGGRGGAAEAAQAAAVPGGPAERRLHADGVRGGCPGTDLRPRPDPGDPGDARGPYEGQGRLRRVHLRDRGDEGGAGDDLRTAAPASAAVHDGGDLIALE